MKIAGLVKKWLDDFLCSLPGASKRRLQEAEESRKAQESEWTAKGRELGKIHQFDEAILCFDKALTINPKCLVAWYNKGVCWMNLGLPDAALYCFDKALEINPSDAQIVRKRTDAASKVDIVDTVFKAGKKDRETSASNQSSSNHASEAILDDVLYLRRMPYKEYLQTEHWQQVRQKALDHAKHRCQLCNASERLQVHHRTYERRGCEELIDLTVLCSYCHAKHHDKLGYSRSSSYRRRRR